MKAILNIFSDFLNLIYPNCCIACDEKLISGEKRICTGCLADMPKTRFDDFTDNEVARLFWGKVKVEAAIGLFHFFKGSKYRSMMHKLKYKGEKEIGIDLGRMIGFEMKDSVFENVDMIVPVPLHSKRLRMRGYNQSEFIANGIGQILEKPVYPNLLKRNVYNISQTGKGRTDRWQNVKGIFELTDADFISGKNVLIVDDIITTGSTLEACILTMEKKVKCNIYIGAVAISKK